MRVLVTGGAGFIGSHLCDALQARGDEVCVVDDLSRGRVSRLAEGVDRHKGNMLNASWLSALVEEIRPDLICHLAAQVDVRVSVAFPGTDAEVNVVGTVNLLEAARGVGARVIFSSTGGALYGAHAPVPSPETTPPAPSSPYGVAKYCAEQYVTLYNRLFGTNHATALRLANVYGPRQGIFRRRRRGLDLLRQQHPGQAAHGLRRRQANARLCLRRRLRSGFPRGRRLRPGWHLEHPEPGMEVSVLQLAALVAQVTGDRSQPVFVPARDGELLRNALSWDLAAADLGWRPVTSLVDGVEAVVRWYAAGAPDRTPPPWTAPRSAAVGRNGSRPTGIRSAERNLHELFCSTRTRF